MLETDIDQKIEQPKNNIDALNQTISHIEEAEDLVKLQNKELKRNF